MDWMTIITWIYDYFVRKHKTFKRRISTAKDKKLLLDFLTKQSGNGDIFHLNISLSSELGEELRDHKYFTLFKYEYGSSFVQFDEKAEKENFVDMRSTSYKIRGNFVCDIIGHQQGHFAYCLKYRA